MKIAVAGGHSKAAPGAGHFIDEYTEDRKVAAALIGEIRNRGHIAYDCSNEKTTQSAELKEECRLANNSGADLFIAIHFNAASVTNSSRGTEVWFYSTSSAGSSYAIKTSQALASKLGLPNRGAKATKNLYVLRNTQMTAILVEVCFVDAKADADAYKRLGAQGVASAIADAIVGAKAPSDPARTTQIYTPNNTNAQKWAVEWKDDKYFALKNLACGLYLDVKSAGTTSGTPVRVYPGNGTKAQEWCMKPVAGEYKPSSLAPVEISPRVNESLRLDCVGGGLKDGTGTQIYTANGTGAQQWTICDLGGGVWTLINNQSAKALDVKSGGK